MVKKIHLTKQSVHQKILKIEKQLERPENKANKTKRKRLFSELVKLRKALQNPEQQLIDPVEEMAKIRQQKQKRISKKIEKKKQVVLQRKKEKRYEKRCLKCGDRGHMLGDCVQQDQEKKTITKQVEDNKNKQQQQFAGGFCYKCGSKTHSHKQCSEQGYKLAVCFYCGKKGHIARECQKNEKGLYRKGGSCFSCGSVRHILKDCPTRRQSGNNYHNRQEF